MKLSAKTDYACKAILELSLQWPKTAPVQIQAIAKAQKIPIKFLSHILIELRRLGLVDSIRGKMGGYILTKPPKDISLKFVIQHFGENANKNKLTYQTPKGTQLFNEIWQDIEDAMWEKFEYLNFEIIKNRVLQENKNPIYVI